MVVNVAVGFFDCLLALHAEQPPDRGCVAISKGEYQGAKKKKLLRARFGTYVRRVDFGGATIGTVADGKNRGETRLVGVLDERVAARVACTCRPTIARTTCAGPTKPRKPSRLNTGTAFGAGIIVKAGYSTWPPTFVRLIFLNSIPRRHRRRRQRSGQSSMPAARRRTPSYRTCSTRSRTPTPLRWRRLSRML